MADITGEESIEVLEAKLAEYRQNLAPIELALEQQPGDQALTKLRSDLLEVIGLTEDLLRLRQQQEQALQQPPPQQHVAAQLPPEAAETAAAAGAVGEGGEKPSGYEYPDDEEQGAEAEGRDEEGDGFGESAEVLERVSPYLRYLGRSCEANYEGTWFNGEIVDVRPDDTLVVEFTGYKNREEYAPQSGKVRILKPPHPSLLQPGAACQAIYDEDGLWYDCTIDEQTELGYKVTFTEYGNQEHVKADQVRLAGTGGGAQAGGKRGKDGRGGDKRRVKEILTPGGYRIPEHLTIKPTDTEDQKKSKKKRMHSIKAKQKQEKEEEEANKKKSSWQKHFNKSGARARVGFMSGKPRDSQFRTADDDTLADLPGPSGGGGASAPQRRHFTQQG
ncbi:unnamed protein product [Vitrella brassicaformis CCMP3155]|uniref:Tudor domain-containing protein n=1 Tax=Vitrella brassicaformis (strain CCMP3155) TaxID=1169540 RepID=A0A0G4EZ54_VITBC|nr:unnamed protein product [Vitrella brassicaformis CCMP3155]|eukprot:CEM04052.1 unnamed protein product [Vitrella brassicaformis CCMP3155]